MTKRWRNLVPSGHAYHVSAALDERRMPIPLHSHDFLEVMWVEEGEGFHRINGSRQKIEAGDLVMIRAQDVHGLAARPGRRFRLQNVAFPRGVARQFGRYFPKGGWGFWLEGAMPQSASLDAEQREALQGEIEWLRNAPRDRISLDTFLLNLMRLLGRRHEPRAGLPEWLETAMRCFGSNEDLVGGVHAFFRLAARCPEHVSRSMKKHCGVSPSLWVNSRRIEQAARLLETTSAPVTEVAAACGFENLGYFHRTFLRQNGTTPLRYRSRHRRVM